MAVEAEEPVETKTVSVTYTEWGEYHYFASFCVSFGYRGKATTDDSLQLRRVWFDGELVYDVAKGNPALGVKLYFKPGTSDQTPFTNQDIGYRDQILLYFSNVDLGTSASIPAVTAEFWDGDALSVAEAIETLAERAGFDPSDILIADYLFEIEMVGYILDGSASLESTLEDMAFLYNYTYFEARGELHVNYAYDGAGEFTPDVTLAEGALAVLSEGSDNPQIDVIAIASDQSLPRSITGSFYNFDKSYERGSETAFRRRDASGSDNEVSFSMPVVMTGREMRSRLFDALAREWNEANAHTLRLPTAHVAVEPGATIAWSAYGDSYAGKVVKATLNADWSNSVSVVEILAEYEGSDVETTQPPLPGEYVNGMPIRTVIMDVPDWDVTQTKPELLNLRIAMGRSVGEDVWLGGQFDWNPANSNTWATPAIFGPDGEVGIGDLILDDHSNMTFYMRNHTEARFAEDDKLLIVGRPGNWELLTFTDAAFTSDGRCTITGLTRGLYGTDDWQDRHAENDTVVFANDAITITYTVEQYRAYTDFSWRATPALSIPTNSEQNLYRPSGNSRRPYSPNNVTMTRDFGGDVLIEWERDDGRFGGEPDNLYSIDIFDADWTRLVRRAQPVTQESYYYPSEYQLEDGLQLSGNINALVFQLNASHVGRGFPGGGGVGVDESDLVGQIGPVVGFTAFMRDLRAWEATIGPVRGLTGTLRAGVAEFPWQATIGPVVGLTGTLRQAWAFGRIGPVVGLTAELAEVVVPVLRRRVACLTIGASLGSPPNLWSGSGLTGFTPLSATVSVGDLVVIHEFKRAGAASDVGSRGAVWTELGELDNRSTNTYYQRVFYAYMTDEDTLDDVTSQGGIACGPFSSINPVSENMTQVLVIRNVDPDDPIEDFTQNKSTSNTTLHRALSVTPDTVNAMILALVGSRTSGLEPTGYTGPSGMELLEPINSTNDAEPNQTSNSLEVSGAFKYADDTDPTGNKTLTFGASAPYMSAMMAIKYAPSDPIDPEPTDDHLYWRILFTAGDNDAGAAALEFTRVKFNLEDVEVSTAAMTWTASSTFPSFSYAPEKVSNPPASPGWSPDFVEPYPVWLGVQLTTPSNIDEVQITPQFAIRVPTAFDVQWSDDGSTWTTKMSFSGFGAWTADVERSFALGPSNNFLAGSIGPVVGMTALMTIDEEDLIELATVVTSGSQTSVSFASIPSGYRDLVLRWTAKSLYNTNPFGDDGMAIRFNGDSGTNYDAQQMFISHTTRAGVRTLAANKFSGPQIVSSLPTAGADEFDSGRMVIADYLGAHYKSIYGQCENTDAANFRMLQFSGRYRSNTAISSMTIALNSGLGFVDGSVLTLYGRR